MWGDGHERYREAGNGQSTGPVRWRYGCGGLATLAVETEGGAERSLGDTQSLGGNADAAAIQGLHGHLEPLPFLGQQVFAGDAAVVEHQLHGG